MDDYLLLDWIVWWLLNPKDLPQITLNGLERLCLSYPRKPCHVSIPSLSLKLSLQLSVYSFPHLLENKIACHNILDTDRRHETPRPESKDSSLITALAAAIVRTFVLVLQALVTTGQSNSSQVVPSQSVNWVTLEKPCSGNPVFCKPWHSFSSGKHCLCYQEQPTNLPSAPDRDAVFSKAVCYTKILEKIVQNKSYQKVCKKMRLIENYFPIDP